MNFAQRPYLMSPKWNGKYRREISIYTLVAKKGSNLQIWEYFKKPVEGIKIMSLLMVQKFLRLFHNM